MATAFSNQFDSNSSQSQSAKVLGERQTSHRVIPSPSKEATARKLDEVSESTNEEVMAQPRLRSKAAQAQAIRDREKANEEAAQRELHRVDMIEKLELKRDELVERLDKGAARIEEARSKGKEVQEWEDYWIQLLRQYEQTCDKLRDLARY